MADLIAIEVVGEDKLVGDMDASERRVQAQINRTMREVQRLVLPILRAEAPRETGRLASSIQGTIFFRGGVVRVTFRVPPTRRGAFDYVPVTRFGHLTARIYPVRKKALTVPGRGRAGRTVLRSSVAGYRPSRDWVDEAAQKAEPVIAREVRQLGNELNTVILR